jgi:hypothetical protein
MTTAEGDHHRGNDEQFSTRSRENTDLMDVEFGFPKLKADIAETIANLQRIADDQQTNLKNAVTQMEANHNQEKERLRRDVMKQLVRMSRELCSATSDSHYGTSDADIQKFQHLTEEIKRHTECANEITSSNDQLRLENARFRKLLKENEIRITNLSKQTKPQQQRNKELAIEAKQLQHQMMNQNVITTAKLEGDNDFHSNRQLRLRSQSSSCTTSNKANNGKLLALDSNAINDKTLAIEARAFFNHCVIDLSQTADFDSSDVGTSAQIWPLSPVSKENLRDSLQMLRTWTEVLQEPSSVPPNIIAKLPPRQQHHKHDGRKSTIALGQLLPQVSSDDRGISRLFNDPLNTAILPSQFGALGNEALPSLR